MKVQSWQAYEGEATNYTVDWSVKAGRLGTTVSSVVWLVDNGSATISNENLTSNVATALITTASEGVSLIKLTAVLADGQTDVFFFKVDANDPKITKSTIGRY